MILGQIANGGLSSGQAGAHRSARADGEIPRRPDRSRATHTVGAARLRLGVLSCLLLVAVAPASASAMTLRMVSVGACKTRQCVLAEGPIEKATPTQFAQFARRRGLQEGAIIFLQSPGGDHVAGIALGQEIRKRGFDTFVAGYDDEKQVFIGADCASACVYAFVGGVQRGADRRSRLGVHQLALTAPVSTADGVMSAQWLMGLASEHLLAMGADPELLTLALKTPSGQVRWLSRKEMRSLRVITLDADLQRPGDALGELSFFDATTP